MMDCEELVLKYGEDGQVCLVEEKSTLLYNNVLMVL